MAITQYTSISTYLNTIYERSMLVAREMTLMAGFVENFSAQGYMTRQFTTRPQISAAAVADAVDFAAPTTFGKSSVGTLTPGEVMAQVLLTHQNMESDPDGAVNQASQELGMAMATKVDTDLLGDFSSFTTDKGAGANATYTLTSLAVAVNYLKTTYTQGTVRAVLHPWHYHDIWVELGKPAATYANADSMTSLAIRNHWVGQILGIPIFTSNNISVDASDDAISGVFAPQSLALDVRSPYRLLTDDDVSLRAIELNGHMGYAHGLGPRPTWGVKQTADAAAP